MSPNQTLPPKLEAEATALALEMLTAQYHGLAEADYVRGPMVDLLGLLAAHPRYQMQIIGQVLGTLAAHAVTALKRWDEAAGSGTPAAAFLAALGESTGAAR